jgi:hypothetical protein
MLKKKKGESRVYNWGLGLRVQEGITEQRPVS